MHITWQPGLLRAPLSVWNSMSVSSCTARGTMPSRPSELRSPKRLCVFPEPGKAEVYETECVHTQAASAHALSMLKQCTCLAICQHSCVDTMERILDGSLYYSLVCVLLRGVLPQDLNMHTKHSLCSAVVVYADECAWTASKQLHT